MPPRRPKSKKNLPSKPAIQKNPLVVEDDSETMEKFKVELQWCVQNVEAAMQKASLKEREDMAKAHRTLTSTKAPHIKKRQVMSSLFGDYRTKMAQEESKLKTEIPRMKKKSVLPSKSVFLKKSVVHFPNITGPLENCEEADVKIQEAERKDSDMSGEGSTTSGFHTGELNPSSGEEASMTGRGTGNLYKRSIGSPEKVAPHYSFTQSGRTFKFNFSLVS